MQALVLFAAGLAVRLVHWLCWPERAAPWTASYQGDAPYWQQAAAGASGLEALLPFRPPAMSWLASAVWDGSAASAWQPRLVFVVLGAAVAPLVFVALRRSFAARVALLAGWICALSSSLISLGDGVHGEIPYLLLFLLTMPDFERLRAGPAPWAALRWSLLHAAACLFRADHALCWAASLAWLCWRRTGQRWRDAAIAVATFAVTLLPWQLHAAAAVADYNAHGAGEVVPSRPRPGALPWDEAAIAAVAAMPAFTRQGVFEFLDATVRLRGGTRVRGDDLRLLDEAYGCRPEPLPRPWLAIYGPLNFFLANSPESDGGFTRRALDRRPPLVGGAERYPRDWLAVLPRDGDLALWYPPHLQALNHGYELGLAWLLAHPGEALALAGRKLQQAWCGAATGLGGSGLPLGRSGWREPVDIVAADGMVATGWRAVLLLGAALGLWRARRHPGAAGWTLWVACKVATVAAFFGYARLGALCVPALALYWALALDAIASRLRPRWEWGAALGAVLVVAGGDGIAAVTARAPTVRPTNQAGDGPHGRVFVEY